MPFKQLPGSRARWLSGADGESAVQRRERAGTCESRVRRDRGHKLIVEDLICPRLIGRNPFDLEVIWEDTHTTLPAQFADTLFDLGNCNCRPKQLGLPLLDAWGRTVRSSSILSR